MSQQRTIIIGDVHGCFKELEKLLKKVEYDPDSDRLIFVGDLINKGPDTLGVLTLVESLNAEVVMGNHDLALLEGRSKLDEVARELGKSLDYWKDYIHSFEPFIEEDDFIVVHAGLIPGEHPSESKLEDIVTIRTWDGSGEDLQNPNNPAWYEFYEGDKLVVFGHWAVLGLMVSDNAICLDSRCVYGEELSALILPERKIVQVKAKKAYCEIP